MSGTEITGPGTAIQLRVARRDGPEILRTFEGREIVVGRLLSADVKIALGPISRRHLVFVARDRGFAVRCGGRRVATRRNGEPFAYQAQQIAAAGDVFEFGHWRIEVVFAGDAGLAAWIGAMRRDGGARSALLRVDRGGRASEWHEALAPKTSIGRSTRADITIPGAYVSRTHVEVECKGRDWSATHRGRLVSTRVNGTKLAPGATASLVNGATIIVGDTRIVACLNGRRPDLRWDEPFTVEPVREPEPPIAATVEPLDEDHTVESAPESGFRSTKIEPRMGPTATPTPSTRPPDHTQGMFDDDEQDDPTPFARDPGDRTQPSVREPPRPSNVPSTWLQTKRSDGAGPRLAIRDGVVVGGCFRAERRRPSDRPAVAWSGTDTQTGAPVWIYDAVLEGGPDAETRARFAADLRRAASLKHAGLERVLHVEQIGEQFLVVTDPPPVTRLAGEISKRARDGVGFAADEIVRIGQGIASALESAGADLCHGALDPEFVGLLPRSAVQVVALGWRELLAAPGAGRLPEYAAPETRDGAGDARADQFSAGAIVRELLATGPGLARNEPGWTKFVARATSARPEDRFAGWAEFRATLAPLSA